MIFRHTGCNHKPQVGDGTPAANLNTLCKHSLSGNFTPLPVFVRGLKLLGYSEEGLKHSYTLLRLIIQRLSTRTVLRDFLPTNKHVAVVDLYCLTGSVYEIPVSLV